MVKGSWHQNLISSYDIDVNKYDWNGVTYLLLSSWLLTKGFSWIGLMTEQVIYMIIIKKFFFFFFRQKIEFIYIWLPSTSFMISTYI